MLKIGRVYLDGCGYQDGVFEGLVMKTLDTTQTPSHHVIHAANGVGKTTILALLFGTFEPDRRKFLRTEINRQHKIEHYFLPNRLGTVALELIKEGSGRSQERHVIGQVFWLTPPSKGDEGEAGQRRFFAYACTEDELSLDTLPFRGLSGGTTLRTLEDFTRWAREMRIQYPGNFFSTDGPAAWRKHMVSELGLDLRVLDVQRRFCAAEGGIGAVFLDFRNEQEFLEKIFSFMISAETAESVIQALTSGLAKIRDLPRRRDQLKALTQLADAFAPFAVAAQELETAEAAHAADLKRLGSLYARVRTQIATLKGELRAVEAELSDAVRDLESAAQLEAMLEGEMLFLEKEAAERRIEDAKAALEAAKRARESARRHLRAARVASLIRRLAAAERTRDELQAELERIERDLAPDRQRLERAGAALHTHLDHLAQEADRDALAREEAAAGARDRAEQDDMAGRLASQRQYALEAEIRVLNTRVAAHTQERKRLEKLGALLPAEVPANAIERLRVEIAAQEDSFATIDLKDEELQSEATQLEGVRSAAQVEVKAAERESARLATAIRIGRELETRVLSNEWLPIVLAAEAKDPYRPDLSNRVRAAHAAQEEVHRSLVNERDKLAAELAFLDAEGVSSVPQDVAEVARVLKETGFPEAQPAEHYLAAFKGNAEEAMALVCRDPAAFTGVFVAKADGAKLSAIAIESRLKLKGPVLVSQATLEPSEVSSQSASSVVFRPFSAARFNKEAAAAEKAEIVSALAEKETQVAASRGRLQGAQALIEDVRQLHDAYAQRRPDELENARDEEDRKRLSAAGRLQSAGERIEQIEPERRELRARRSQLDQRIEELRRHRQDVQQFATHYADIEASIGRIPQAAAERDRKETDASMAWAAAATAREVAAEHDAKAVELRTKASGWRNDKRRFPHTDGNHTELAGTLDDFVEQYQTAERLLISKRDAQVAQVTDLLQRAKAEVISLTQEREETADGVSPVELESFGFIADLERAISEAELESQRCHDVVIGAEGSVNVAEAKSGPVVRAINEAKEKRGVLPISVGEFVGATVESCEAAREVRQRRRSAAEQDIRTLSASRLRLDARRTDITSALQLMQGLVKRAEDHLPEHYRAELPDLSVDLETIEVELGQLIGRLAEVTAQVTRLRQSSDDRFEEVRSVYTAEAFRQLEPQVAENLRSYSARTAGADRQMLQSRLAERKGVVEGEIENQRRDQNACLEQLRQHVVHADDLLRRAMRCSKIPENIPNYGGERILRIKRTLRDVSSDIIHHQLSVWLDEQAVTGRIPQHGALLAAELLNCVHGGRSLDIELLKPKRDAIQPYMRVDRMGLSGGEGVTVAMMLYAVIQKMAMDERAAEKTAASGGFLLLDNTYGMSNMIEHVVLQMTMADLLGIQLFVTTCSEDKHVVNMFPTITRLVQGERVFVNGQPQYIRVRSGEYVFKAPEHVF